MLTRFANPKSKGLGRLALSMVVGSILSACSNAPDKSPPVPPANATAIEEKQAPAMQYYYAETTVSQDEMASAVKSIATNVALSATKRAKLDIDGPLILSFVDLQNLSPEAMPTRIGFPVKGSPARATKYGLESKPEFKCLSKTLDSSNFDHKAQWTSLYEWAQNHGYEVSGENRVVISAEGRRYYTELQLGVL